MELSNYLLYNFEDEPKELYYRMRLNVDLCEELGVTIYSFPMKYHPISDPAYFKNRDYLGERWNRKFIRAVQAVLNSTKGKIGKGVVKPTLPLEDILTDIRMLVIGNVFEWCLHDGKNDFEGNIRSNR